MRAWTETPRYAGGSTTTRVPTSRASSRRAAIAASEPSEGTSMSNRSLTSSSGRTGTTSTRTAGDPASYTGTHRTRAMSGAAPRAMSSKSSTVTARLLERSSRVHAPWLPRSIHCRSRRAPDARSRPVPPRAVGQRGPSAFAPSHCRRSHLPSDTRECERRRLPEELVRKSASTRPPAVRPVRTKSRL